MWYYQYFPFWKVGHSAPWCGRIENSQFCGMPLHGIDFLDVSCMELPACKFWGFENWWWAQYLVSNLHELSRVYQILNRYEAWTRSAAKPLHWVVAGLFSCLVLELSTYNAMLRSYHHFHVIRFGGCHLQRSDYNKYWVDEDHSGAPKIAKLVYD